MLCSSSRFDNNSGRSSIIVCGNIRLNWCPVNWGHYKGKSAIRIFREYQQVKRNFTGRHFWARGYCVSTVGLDEQVIRAYIQNQEKEEIRQEQLSLPGM